MLAPMKITGDVLRTRHLKVAEHSRPHRASKRLRGLGALRILRQFRTQLFDLTAKDFVFLTFTNEKASGNHCLFSEPLGCENIGIATFILRCREPCQLHQATLEECANNVIRSPQTDPELFCQGPLGDPGIISDEPQRPQFGFIAQTIRSPAHFATADPRLPHGLTREGDRVRVRPTVLPLGRIVFNSESISSGAVRASKIR